MFFAAPAYNAIAKILQGIKISISHSMQSRHATTLMNLAALDCGLALLPESLAITNEELTVIPLEPAILVIPIIFSKTGRHPEPLPAAWVPTPLCRPLKKHYPMAALPSTNLCSLTSPKSLLT